MNDSEKFFSIPEEIIFQSYWQRTLDRLRIVYDPAYSSTEMIGDSSIIDRAYSGIWSYLPDFARNGANLLEFTESIFPRNGMAKNLGYLPFLAWFSVASRMNQMILDFDFPEDGTPVSPENIALAMTRFPNIHGVNYISQFTSWLSYDSNFIYPRNLVGTAVKTYAKYQMAKALDAILDHNFALIHTENTFLTVDVPEFYKRTDIYCTFDMTVFAENGEVVRESTSTVFLQKTYGEFGWFSVGSELCARRSVLRVGVYSKSLLRYKFLVICQTDSNKADYGTCRYDFCRSGKVLTAKYSVIYESPDWCIGDSVWEYEFLEGSKPADHSPDYVRIQSPAVIVFPEFPDRFDELYKTQIERS